MYWGFLQQAAKFCVNTVAMLKCVLKITGYLNHAALDLF
jgi:hypothetical protein